MAKAKHLDPPVEVRVNIPESVLAEVDLRLFDPLRGRIRYGARSKLVTRLLRSWLEKGYQE